MIAIVLFDNECLSDVDLQVIRYVNDNIKSIITVLIDYLKDDNGFTSKDFLPYNNFRIDDTKWIEWIYDLYDIVCSEVIRDYLKPIYEYMLYVIIQWWEDCSDDTSNILPNIIAEDLRYKIQKTYTTEDSKNYVFDAITNYKNYYDILFQDHDFLPSNLERLVTMYLINTREFEMFFPDMELNEYIELMPKDLRQQYEELNKEYKKSHKLIIEESRLLRVMLSCCERVQANSLCRNYSENSINDYIRDLLSASNYDVRDQTRQGTSSVGKQAGQIDILIRKDKLPFSVIESLKLSSLDKAYIAKHIDKIYKYDTFDNKFNYIISYVQVKNFSTFWSNYLEYVKDYQYPYALSGIHEYKDNQNSELRYLCIELIREEVKTRLYHIVVHIPF